MRSSDSFAAGRSFAIINRVPSGRAGMAAVIGLSNKAERLLHMERAEADGLTIIRRFSGGGTVLIDDNCWMVTLIVNRNVDQETTMNTNVNAPEPLAAAQYEWAAMDGEHTLPHVPHPSTLLPYPNRIMDWTRDFYTPVFNNVRPTTTQLTQQDDMAAPEPFSAAASPSSSSLHSHSLPFSLTGSDYCLSDRKFGGNAQTITKSRWLHHTSFLWSTRSILPNIERYLQIPEKQPEYRQGREHKQFLIGLEDVWKRHLTTDTTAAAAAELVDDVGTQQLQVERMMGELLMQGEVGEQHFHQGERTNAPPSPRLLREYIHTANLFHSPYRHDSAAMLHTASTSTSSPTVTSLSIPPSLPSRFLWRLSHFFTLDYPSLDSIHSCVEAYHAAGKSAIKILDYEEERQKRRMAQQVQLQAIQITKQQQQSTTAAASISNVVG